nr:MAG TPA: hypothetical protein [Caudoviricetes sp.]
MHCYCFHKCIFILLRISPRDPFLFSGVLK